LPHRSGRRAAAAQAICRAVVRSSQTPPSMAVSALLSKPAMPTRSAGAHSGTDPSYLADRFLVVVSAATLIQSVVVGWRDGFHDFEIFYLSAGAVRRCIDSYSSLAGQGVGPNTNHPAVMVLMRPLTYLSFFQAAMLWLALGLLALVLTVRAIAPDVVPASRRV